MTDRPEDQTPPNRRSFLAGSLAAAAAAAFAPAFADKSLLAREFGPGAEPVRYPDPDIVVIDDRFKKIKIGNTPIRRLATDMLWAEGPAWNGVGRYLVWSDIPNDRQMRYIEDDGHVSVMRKPAGNSNGNTFDYQGRQLSCEHGNRRVVRYEYDGSTTVVADKFEGKRLNAPNDVVVHPNGDIWFTDPGYGSMMHYEGNKGELELKEAVYRVDGKSMRISKVTDEIIKPNGLCFSADYKKLYVADSGASHSATPIPADIKVWDIVDDKTLADGKPFVTLELDGKRGIADGIRCDTEGNIWSSAGWVGDGFDGVHIFSPDGKRIGQIRLPEICSNVCFGGRKRNILFMTGSQSLYSVYVEAQGAHIT